MSKEEILKIQKCVLKVNIHCDGCKQKVKKTLQKIDGVFTTEIDADQGKVMVSGNVDPNVLIKKLAKSGKHAELWGAPKVNNNNNNQNLVNQMKNMHIENGKGGGGGNNKAASAATTSAAAAQHQQQLQQFQQLQQMKGMQDLKLPQFKDLKLPPQNPNQKAVKFNVPEGDEYYDEFDDEDYDDEDYDDEFDDEMDYLPPLKMGKQPPMQMGNGAAAQMMLNGMMNGNHPQFMNAQKGGNPGGNAAANGKKSGGGGGGAVPIQVMGGGNEGKNGNGGKKGGGGNNQNQGGGNKNNSGKNGGGMPEGKNGHNGGGGGGNGNNGNGGKKVSGMDGMHAMIQNMGGHPHAAMAAANRGPMGNMSMPMGQMNNIPAVQGLPATSMNGGVGGGYFQGAGPDVMPGNPYHHQQQQHHQQQYLAAMMNQQRAMGNDRYQPMMYARPPPDVNYLPPSYGSYGYHPYPPPEPYSNFFNDENTSSCSIM
ncbi:hypothetical protein L6164_012677 [Bauhinia variegata]|uniref:Uncharacterized protein n=1 Tax=Bauhinia variegata TaxID=167791 RepID=A0ACB9P9T3_BAUVA|nr:hypothetical protein L6164_012677 [Bauhinia variegata]